jgi:nitrogen fixation/metabolism regulation signal transduction histidine kinase
MARRYRRLTHEQEVFAFCLVGGLPAVVFALVWAFSGDRLPEVRWTAAFLVVASWLGFSLATLQRVTRPLQTMSNLLLALKEGDFSFRARGARQRDPLGDVLLEINGLGDILQAQRRGTMEATALLSAVIKEIDVAIFAFDPDHVLRLVNPAGQVLLGRTAEHLLGLDAAAIGLSGCLEGEPERILGPGELPKAYGRWGMRRTPFREDGRPHQLVVFGDLSRPLREEQLKSWQRLVRVLGHELNNSLAPIKSIATTLGTSMDRAPRQPDLEGDLRSGLGIIATRAESLERFLQGYTRLAKLPPPQATACDLGGLLRRAAALERRLPVVVDPGPNVAIMADPAQVEQAVINLVKNAVEAAMEQKHGEVRVSWRNAGSSVEILIEDNGAGISDTANLFVPFFTTKPDGSGIGLVLCQQIAENHGGTLTLQGRKGQPGCMALLRLPRSKG